MWTHDHHRLGQGSVEGQPDTTELRKPDELSARGWNRLAGKVCALLNNNVAEHGNWFTWTGGTCPVALATPVDYVMRSDHGGRFHTDPAGNLDWSRRSEPRGHDIVQWRLYRA